MKVVIAVDSFKGSLTSLEAGTAIASGIRAVFPEAEIALLPVADGGEGTVDALVRATSGRIRSCLVTGPLGDKVNAEYGILGDSRTAVIEIAAACGLPLVPAQARNPLQTTTYGVGELISDAMDEGCREFIVGLGGSSTNDAGVGMLQALGFRFLDAAGKPIGMGSGAALAHIERIDLIGADPRLEQCTFKVACDVTNPLYGPTGAAFIFGPQKGADAQQVQALDAGLKHYAFAVLRETGAPIHEIPGAGAAGGLGAAFAGFLPAELQSGASLVLEAISLEDKLRGADWLITGEGRLDGQTSMGKAPLAAARLAKRLSVPVIALAGTVTEEASALHAEGVTAYFSIGNGPMTLEQALMPAAATSHLQSRTGQLFRLIAAAGASG